MREFFADQAPRVVVVVDRRPRMSLSRPPLPWLDKAAATEAAVRLIAAATVGERGDLGAVEMAGGRPRWIAPRQPADVLALRDRRARGLTYDADAGSLEACIALLGRHALGAPGRLVRLRALGLHRRRARARRGPGCADCVST